MPQYFNAGEYYAKNRERITASNRQHYAEHRERINAAQRARYHALPPEKRRKRNAAQIERRRQLRKSNRDFAKQQDLKKKYGISLETYNEMLAEQNQKCAICCDGINGSAQVDHCHATGRVRGILCKPCNMGLGSMRDNIASLRNAIAYLEKSNAAVL